MGRLSRGVLALAVAVLVATAAWPAAVLGFSGFGSATADATYGEELRFSVELEGGAPDRLELLLRFAGDDVPEGLTSPIELAAFRIV